MADNKETSSARRHRARWLLVVLFLIMTIGNTVKQSTTAFEQQPPVVSVSVSVSVSVEQSTKRLTLDELLVVAAPTASCPEGTESVGPPKKLLREKTTQIPKMIHQTNIVDCLPPTTIATTIDPWRKLPDFEYYFHSKTTMDTFLNQDWLEFPHLASIVQCVSGYNQGYVDLWKALILYEFGGAVMEFDIVPDNLFETLIQPDDQAIVLSHKYRNLEGARVAMPYPHGILLEKGHPLSYYMVMHTLNGITKQRGLATVDWSALTSKVALESAWFWFVIVDLQKKMKGRWHKVPEFGYNQQQYIGRYGKTARFVPFHNITKLVGSSGDWRAEQYPKIEEDGGRWNVTCMKMRYDYLLPV